MIIDISTVIPAMAFILYVFFVIFGFMQYKREGFYWSFQLYMVFVTIWSFGSMMMHLNSSCMTPLFWNKIMLIGMLSVPFALSHFIVDMVNITNRSIRIFIGSSYLLIVPLMILNFSGSIVSDAGFTPSKVFFYKLAPGAISAYSISYLYLIITLIFILISTKQKSFKKTHKSLLLPLIGVLFMLIGILMNLFPVLGKYPIDIFAATINALLLFYTIYRYQLINYSRIAISVIYSTILLVIASLSYFIIISLIQQVNPNFIAGNKLLLPIILAVVTVLIIYPVRNLLTYIVDSIIIPKRHPYQASIRDLSQKLTTIVNLKELGEEVVKNLSTSVKTEWVIFMVKHLRNGESFTMIANNGCPTSLHEGEEVVLSFTPPLQEELQRIKHENISTVINAKAEGDRLTICDTIPPPDVLIPLVIRKQIEGYILIGYDYTKTITSPIEIEALEILAAQSSLSLENALSFEQLRVQGEELTISKNKMEAIFNGIAAPVCLINIDYTIQEANAAAVAFYGNNKQELIGSKCYHSFFQRSKPCEFCQAQKCLYSKQVQETETSINDQCFSFQFHNVKVPENSERVFVEIINNITEQKYMQEELARTEKMAGIGTLAAGIAHELNNPLAGILGTAEILLSEIEKSHIHHEYLEDILSYSKSAADVIKELSVYARNEQEEQDEIKSVEIIRILEFSLRLALRGVDSQNITVKRDYQSLPFLEANEGKLQQLFLNFIVNAIQAMDGRGTLTLTCRESDGLLFITISDTGEGIVEENINQIFTPFFTTKAPGSGTGLGLSNCYSIVEKMGGRIRVQSEMGVGTEFTTIFPSTDERKEAIRFTLVEDREGMNDVFYIQRKVLVEEKGYLEESIHRKEDEKAMHILAFKGLHPIGTVSLLTSEQLWPLPIAEYIDIPSLFHGQSCSEILRLAVLPEIRNTSTSIGLIVLVFLLARSIEVENLIIDVFSNEENTIKLYKKFGFKVVGTYNSPSEVTVLTLQSKTPQEKDANRIKFFISPLFARLRPMFDFGSYTQGVLDEMDKILTGTTGEES